MQSEEMRNDSVVKTAKIVKPVRIRRVTGYLGYVDSFNDGKFNELRERTSNDSKVGFQRDVVLTRG